MVVIVGGIDGMGGILGVLEVASISAFAADVADVAVVVAAFDADDADAAVVDVVILPGSKARMSSGGDAGGRWSVISRPTIVWLLLIVNNKLFGWECFSVCFVLFSSCLYHTHTNDKIRKRCYIYIFLNKYTLVIYNIRPTHTKKI